MGETEYLDYVKAKRRYAPWFLFALIVFLVLSITFSAFQQVKQSPATDKDAAGQSLQENLRRANPPPDQKEKPPQNATQSSPPQPNFIGKIQPKTELNVHSAPERSSKVVASAQAGSTLSVKGKVGKWYQVITPGNAEGYVTSNTKYINVLEMKE